jgi:hypothetical protein
MTVTKLMRRAALGAALLARSRYVHVVVARPIA